MRIPLIRTLIFILCCGLGTTHALAQAEPMDSLAIPKNLRSARTDSLYFEALKARLQQDSSMALRLFEDFVTIRPNVGSAHYELSRLYYNTHSLDKAEASIKKALATDSTNKWYKEQYATILADKESFLEAANIMADLYRTNPGDPTYSIMAAEYYQQAQKYEEAISYLDKAFTLNGSDDEIVRRKVRLYLKVNKIDKAAEVVKQLIEKEPGNGEYYKFLGDLYDNNKMPEKAAAVYERALKILPGNAMIQLGMAEHYLKAGDTASYTNYLRKLILNKELDAGTQLNMLSAYIQGLPNDSVQKAMGIPVIRQLVVMHPDDAQVLSFFGEFMEMSETHDSAAWAYKRSIALTPGKFAVWQNLLNAYTEKEYADSLIKYSEKAMRLFPNQAVAHYFNGIGHMNKKEYPAAIKAVTRAIDLEPEQNILVITNMYGTLADLYHSNNQEDLSDKAFDKALELDPRNATVLNNYSYYLSQRGKKLDLAEKMSKKSLEIRPGEATFLDTYGWVLYKKGDFEKAREFIAKAIETSGGKADATLYDHLGDIYFKLNDKDNAIRSWKTAKEKGSDDPQLDKKISEGKLYE